MTFIRGSSRRRRTSPILDDGGREDNMKIANGFVRRTVGDSYMVVPVGTRARDVQGVIALSESGALLWEKLEHGATEDELVDAMLAEYEVEREQAEADVRAFVGELRDEGIIEE